MIKAKVKKSRNRDRYMDLVQEFPLRPIRTETRHDEAVDFLAALLPTESGADPGEIDYILVLTDLIESYEKEKHRIGLSHIRGVDLVRHMMENRKMTIGDLAKIVGSYSAASMLYNRQRQISRSQAIKLADYFQIGADVFLR